MKILAIRLKNLASLAGPFEVDFTAEPLASAGLFAITGPTGAGKSTLLDALCLALFGAVPRLSRVGQSKVPDVDGEITTSDPRTLLRRGTGSGYAEVDFVGIDQRRYRARWETNRARDNASKKLQASRQILTDLDSEQLLSNQSKREFEQLIEQRLGLNFEQFTRAVMLAQSEFSAFLKADDKERSELLEKLTNTAIYSQLGKRAFLKANEARKALEELTLQATGIAPLAAEARTELDQQLTQAQAQLKSQHAQLKTLEQQQQALLEQSRLEDEAQAAREHLHSAEQYGQQLAGERQTLEQLERLGPQRHRFARQATLTTQLSPLARSIAQQRAEQQHMDELRQRLQADSDAAQAALLAAQQQAGEARGPLQQAFELQNTLRHQAKALQDLQATCQQSEQQIHEARQGLEDLQERQQQADQRLTTVAERLQLSVSLAALVQGWSAWEDRFQSLIQAANRWRHGQQELPALEQAAHRAAERLTERSEALQLLYREADCEVEAVPEQLQLLGELLQDNRRQCRVIEDLKRLWSNHQDLQRQHQSLGEQLRSAAEEREQLASAGSALNEQLKQAEQAFSVTRELLERQRLARSASVETLRNQLQDDQPCPVCGSVEHPWHQPEALLQGLAEFDDNELAQAEQTVERFKERRSQLREQYGVLTARMKDLLGQQEQVQGQLQALDDSLHQHAQANTLLQIGAEQRADWLERQHQQLEQTVAKDEQRQQALLDLQRHAASLQRQRQEAEQASQQARQLLDDQQRQLGADRTRLDEALGALAPLLPAETLQALHDDTSATVMRLQQQVAERQALLEQQRDEEQEREQRQKALEKQQQAQDSLTQRHTQLQQQVKQLDEQQQATRSALSALLGQQASAEHWQQALEQAVERARSAQAQAAQALQEHQARAIQLAAELKASEQQHQALQEEQAGLSEQLNAWRAQHTELDDTTLQRLLEFDDAHLEDLRQRLQASDKALEQSRVLLQEREQRLAQQHARHPDLPDATALEQAMQQVHERCAALDQQCADLRAQVSEDQRRQAASAELQARIEQASAERQRWGRLAELIGSAEGDRFRKIAQAYNLDLLVLHANAQLRQLVRRYRLKRGGSLLGLLVMDTEMGDELRSVHSLSGGETFLVSLALALGLASMASSTLRIESLFIDEGFGSLDPESLQLAMDALDGLQAQGRKVGVISHVQEMHERIAVQIRVKRQGNGLSQLEVGS
ncbi:AAA family ATPase [Pseudomonas sp. DTU_2021_1001937_2_SI_NGA_ILE_001]|uniref:AAA family ATPase n=1 Tax=Pseudomonas sp. DTU_2021_1001937_2_SI_NGA_ILE_001 TaxID=3077589 RepID=UPI0028FC2B96|nr:AAA family ATPase [Pseudomonas sp. DTU_2021_1001937_2_SI_NGA_ILE_001]WNW14160.1 AAA family ATPase [Pseudomonas sp. DTU_2021_1001937_2_SI_NGA_ILE_001]